MNLEILHCDEVLVAVNKPHGLLVHRTSIAADADSFALQLLRDQLNRKVFPVHRLDRKTSGVLLFSFDQPTLAKMQKAFASGQITKVYKAIVRGFTNEEDIIDYPLMDEKFHVREAVTRYRTIERKELDLPFGKFSTSRYSLVEIIPKQGRMHQIRKHFAHIFHPIIGDRPYGCNKQNRLFKEKWNMNTMMLHAEKIIFKHPIYDETLEIKAPLQGEFNRMLNVLQFNAES
ncbi:MAG: pseudouridylate synthase [Cyclobacteriaceae bacterium]|nr:pseudouridylate synthase [Cyclobacteriaceae bacterium]